LRSILFAALLIFLMSFVSVSGVYHTSPLTGVQAPGSTKEGSIATAPPTGIVVTIRSVFGRGFLNNSGSFATFPATLFLNMTVQSSNATTVVFSVDSGNVTEGIQGLACPSPTCDYRVWKVISGTAVLSYGRLSISATTVMETPIPNSLWKLVLAGPARAEQSSTTSSTSYELYTLLYGHISDGTTSIGLLYLVGIGVKLGDIDMDGKIDIVDLATVAASFGSCMGQPNYNPYADVDMDGTVNIQDLATVAFNFGQTY